MPWRITLCFHFIIFPPVFTTLVSLGSCQVWQQLLDPKAPETIAISYSETICTLGQQLHFCWDVGVEKCATICRGLG